MFYFDFKTARPIVRLECVALESLYWHDVIW